MTDQRAEASLTPRYRVVIAEDNAGDSALARMALSQAGLACESIVFQDGARVIDWFAAQDSRGCPERVDLLLLDWNLPKCDGAEILDCLLGSRHYPQTPVIVITGSDAPREYEHALRGGVLRYFRKASTLEEYMRLGTLAREILRGESGSGAAGVETGALPAKV